MPTTSIDPVVAKNLKDTLKRIGRSAYSVAVALRRPPNWLYQITSGKYGISIAALREVADEIGVPVGSLIDPPPTDGNETKQEVPMGLPIFRGHQNDGVLARDGFDRNGGEGRPGSSKGSGCRLAHRLWGLSHGRGCGRYQCGCCGWLWLYGAAAGYSDQQYRGQGDEKHRPRLEPPGHRHKHNSELAFP